MHRRRLDMRRNDDINAAVVAIIPPSPHSPLRFGQFHYICRLSSGIPRCGRKGLINDCDEKVPTAPMTRRRRGARRYRSRYCARTHPQCRAPAHVLSMLGNTSKFPSAAKRKNVGGGAVSMMMALVDPSAGDSASGKVSLKAWYTCALLPNAVVNETLREVMNRYAAHGGTQ
eukprot:gene12769-biopygen2111